MSQMSQEELEAFVNQFADEITDEQAENSDIGGDSDAEDDQPISTISSTRISSTRQATTAESGSTTTRQNTLFYEDSESDRGSHFGSDGSIQDKDYEKMLDSLQKNCKRCNILAKSCPKCISCGTISHTACAKLLKNIDWIDEKAIECCEDDLESSFESAINEEGSSNITTVKYFKDILKQKDIIIDNLEDKISILKQQIALLTKLNNIDTASSSEKTFNLVKQNTETLTRSTPSVKVDSHTVPPTATEIETKLKKPKQSKKSSILQNKDQVNIVQIQEAKKKQQ
ncbi:unnamed protein product [Brassicogethes aeneus]|uniref:Phorbol-ester/DAG-type domain-containing protein n=1 Tax=Brassicogethes aeneus TaxID=1431903 RepID=A0A9P0BJ21_BRAAE|nr:unnamed protein product [Brassicogethes aeneus]